MPSDRLPHAHRVIRAGYHPVLPSIRRAESCSSVDLSLAVAGPSRTPFDRLLFEHECMTSDFGSEFGGSDAVFYGGSESRRRSMCCESDVQESLRSFQRARTEFLWGAGGCPYPYSLRNMKDLVDRFGVPLRPILRGVPFRTVPAPRCQQSSNAPIPSSANMDSINLSQIELPSTTYTTASESVSPNRRPRYLYQPSPCCFMMALVTCYSLSAPTISLVIPDDPPPPLGSSSAETRRQIANDTQKLTHSHKRFPTSYGASPRSAG